MDCLNEFCIYQKNNKCMLDEITLDINGRCEECIYPNLPPDILEHEKDKVRKSYEAEDNNP